MQDSTNTRFHQCKKLGKRGTLQHNGNMGKQAHLDVMLAFDADNQIWFVERSDLPGLCVEAATLDEMQSIIGDLAPDLFATNVPEHQRDWPLRIQHVIDLRRPQAA